MIVTSLAIAGTGALGYSVKVYRQEKRKKEFPWTVAAERMGIYPLVRRKRENRFIASEKRAFSKLMLPQKRAFSPETDSLDVKSPSSPPDET